MGMLYWHREGDSPAQFQAKLQPCHGGCGPNQDIQMVGSVGKVKTHHLTDFLPLHSDPVIDQSSMLW